MIGRPTKYDPSNCQVVLDYIGDQGKSVTQLARHLKISKKTIYNWADANPDFLHALELAQEWSQGYWEDQLESFMTDRTVNAPLVKLYFANRFGWRDTDTQETKSEPITINIVKPNGAD